MTDDTFAPHEQLTTQSVIPIKYELNDGDMVSSGTLAWNGAVCDWGVREMTFRWETPVPIEYFPDAARAFAELVRMAAYLHVNQLPALGEP